MSGQTDLIAIGHAAMANAHMLILFGGLLGVLSIVAGLLSRRIGAPVLLTFLVLGMLAGDDGGLGGIRFDDFAAAYLIGSVALAVILFDGGLRTPVSVLRLAFWPAAALATIGVAITAAIMGGILAMLEGVRLSGALLAGAAAAPTDAAAVAVLLMRARIAIPERLSALIEVESGLNDPMSVFLTVLLITVIARPGSLGVWSAGLLFVREMAGGAVLGLLGGAALAQGLKRLHLEPALATVLVLTGSLLLFGLAQALGTSGFLAIYLAGVTTSAAQHQTRRHVEHFMEGMAWLAQIVLFLMLGLLISQSPATLYRSGDSRHCSTDFPGTPGRGLRLSAPISLYPARNGLRILGRATRRGADLPQHHSSARRSRPRRKPVRKHLHPGDRLASGARLDH